MRRVIPNGFIFVSRSLGPAVKPRDDRVFMFPKLDPKLRCSGLVLFAEGPSACSLHLELQAKVLRFLQERVIERFGGTKEIPVDVRIICATHRPMNEMIQSKIFREDLYFRISDITIELPPLRERDDDIVVLARVFLAKYANEQGRKIYGLSQAVETMLLAYECRGNVRELDKIIRRAVIMTEDSYLQPHDLQLEIDPCTIPENLEATGSTLNLAMARNIADKRTILQALEHEDGNISKAAKLLDVSRPTLYSLIERLGLSIDS